MKNVGVKNPCLYEMAAALTFLLSDKNDVCSFTDSATMSPVTVWMKLHETWPN